MGAILYRDHLRLPAGWSECLANKPSRHLTVA